MVNWEHRSFSCNSLQLVIILLVIVSTVPVGVIGVVSVKDSDQQDDVLISLALLSTFPRSGTSWVRELVACASGLDTRLTQSKQYPSHETVLKRLFTIKEECASGGPCSKTSIFPWLVNRSILQPSVDFTKLQSLMSEDHKLDMLSGIKAAATMEYDPVCDEVAAARPKQMVQARQRWMEELSVDGALPPPLIKTHYPVVVIEDGIPLTNELIANSGKRVHLTRNPFDNIISHLHGNPTAFEARKANKWNRLQRGSREAFTNFVRRDVERYTSYHTYWLNKSMSEENGAEVFYIRYESFCQNSATVLPKLLEFLGYPRDEKAMACALSLYPCSFSENIGSLPEHVHMYTPEELQLIQKGTADIMTKFGYKFNVASKKLSLHEPLVSMHNV